MTGDLREENLRRFTIGVLRRSLGRVDDDMVSACTLAGLEAWRRWSPDGGASRATWVARRIRGEAVDELRRRDGRPGTLRGDTLELPTDDWDALPVAAEPPAAVDTELDVRHLLTALPAQHRFTLWALVCWDWTAARVAEHLDVSEGSVWTWRREGLTLLRHAVAAAGGEVAWAGR